MEIPQIGKVIADPQFHRNPPLVSEPIPIPFLHQHRCRFVLKRYIEDPNREEIHAAIKNILTINDDVLTEAQQYVYQYYEDMAALFAAHNWPSPPKIETPADVWKHVSFGDSLYVQRRKKATAEDGVYVSLGCNCDWEEEHGLQIVLRDGLKVTKVGPFDDHLTNAAAFADPSLIGVIYRRIGVS
jgi:hypothetical protein